jgi:hypothetical protein
VSLERRPRPIALIVGAILIGLGLAAAPPFASAALNKDVVGAAGATVKSVQATPQSVPPPLPNAAPPAQAPAKLPTRAQAPAPRAPAELPTRATPTLPQPSTGSDSAAPATGGEGDGVDPVGVVKSVTAEAPARTTFTGTDGDGRPAAGGSSDSGPSDVSASGERSSPPPSIRAARAAPLQRWLAYVWPAIRLGGGAGRASPVVAIAEGLLRPAAALAQKLALALSHARRPIGLPLAGGPGSANPRHAPLPTIPPVGDRSKTLYLIALAALMALLAFTVWREFRSALRPARWRL